MHWVAPPLLLTLFLLVLVLVGVGLARLRRGMGGRGGDILVHLVEVFGRIFAVLRDVVDVGLRRVNHAQDVAAIDGANQLFRVTPLYLVERLTLLVVGRNELAR